MAEPMEEVFQRRPDKDVLVELTAPRKIELTPERAEEIILAVEMAIKFLELKSSVRLSVPVHNGISFNPAWYNFCAKYGLPYEVRNENTLPPDTLQLSNEEMSCSVMDLMIRAYSIRRGEVEKKVIAEQDAVRSKPIIGKYLSQRVPAIKELSGVEADNHFMQNIVREDFRDICRVLGIVPMDKR